MNNFSKKSSLTGKVELVFNGAFGVIELENGKIANFPKELIPVDEKMSFRCIC